MCADDEQFAQFEVQDSGTGLHWETLDGDLSVPELLAELFGNNVCMASGAGLLPLVRQ